MCEITNTYWPCSHPREARARGRYTCNKSENKNAGTFRAAMTDRWASGCYASVSCAFAGGIGAWDQSLRSELEIRAWDQSFDFGLFLIMLVRLLSLSANIMLPETLILPI